jgi:hypothetical protein
MAIRRFLGAALAILALTACTGDGDHYANAEELAAEIERAGLGCKDAHEPRLGLRPPGESEAVCTVFGRSITIHVMEDDDGLERIKRFNSGGNDETPVVFWLYGANWFIATQAEDLMGPLEAELGGDRADNTDF